MFQINLGYMLNSCIFVGTKEKQNVIYYFIYSYTTQKVSFDHTIKQKDDYTYRFKHEIHTKTININTS